MKRSYLLPTFTLFTILPLISSVYRANDTLGDNALKVVPAVLGSDVTLRCTKVLQQDRYDQAVCTDPQRKGCGFVWSKLEGPEQSDSKIKTYESFTKGYCNMSELTENAVKSFNFGEIEFPEYNYIKHSTCLTGLLVIKNFTLDDFGNYSCNFSYHAGSYDRIYDHPIIHTIEVVKAGSKPQPFEVNVFNYYTQAFRTEMLLQCVVTGGMVQWLASVQEYEYSEYPSDKSCSYQKCPKRWSNFDPLNFTRMDHVWKCYNVTMINFEQSENVTESLLSVKNICHFDPVLAFSCSVGGKNGIVSDFVVIKLAYKYYPPSYVLIVPLCFTIPVMLILVIVFMIFALIRARVCCEPIQSSTTV